MEYEANIFAFVDKCDRRIRAAHRRLERNTTIDFHSFHLESPVKSFQPFLICFYLAAVSSGLGPRQNQ